jgi:hypothetical protein
LASRFELDQGNVLLREALITNPLCVDLLREEVKSPLGKSGAYPVEPEVAARLTQDGLVIVMYLFVADPTWINGRSIRILRVEHHRLSGRVHFLV